MAESLQENNLCNFGSCHEITEVSDGYHQNIGVSSDVPLKSSCLNQEMLVTIKTH